jgi:hypothetical protein
VIKLWGAVDRNVKIMFKRGGGEQVNIMENPPRGWKYT